MDTNQSTPQEASVDTSPMVMAAIALHETFNTLMAGGFTEDQALTIIARTIKPLAGATS